MIVDWLVGKILDASFSKVNQYLTNFGGHLGTSKKDLEGFLSAHLTSVENWCAEVNFADLNAPRHTMKVYIGLDAFVIPRRLIIEPGEKPIAKPLDNVLSDSSEHLVLLGHPGAGKSTSMKYVCHRILTEESFMPEQNFPLVLRLRELNTANTLDTDSNNNSQGRVIISAIAKHLGLIINFANEANSKKEKDERDNLEDSVAMTFIEELSPLIILDGFDELFHSSRREAAIMEIRSMVRQFKKARIILTSRTGEFPYQIDNTSLFEISPLSDSQISEFARKWLGNEAESQRFLNKLSHSPYADTAMKPLTLAHLCALYERAGDIPPKPKTVYRKIVQLLVDEWDEQRSVKRQSKNVDFTPDRKFEFLSQLSYELTVRTKGNVFSTSDLERIFKQICLDYDLSPKAKKEVFGEIESHTGLFLKSGYEDYEFVHRSLQEYLAAEYIVRLPALPDSKKVIEKIPNELAIAITISSNSSSYFMALVMTRLNTMNLKHDFYSTFITRLLQEKPEFNAHPNVVVALLTLYSSYLGISAIGNKGIQLPLFLVDKLTSEYENFMQKLAKRNSLKIIHDYYVRSGKQPTGFGGEVIILTRNDNGHRIEMPKILYSREVFLNQYNFD